MEREGRTLVPVETGAEVLDAREVQGIFGLLGRGWRVKAIARELGLARNTVRAWVRRGPDAGRARTGRPLALVGQEDWLKARFLAGVRNADVLRQELAERGLVVSLRTVERFVSPLRAEAVNEDRATLRFETEPGKQMPMPAQALAWIEGQIDFGEKWIEVAGARVKAFMFVATLGYSRRSFIRVYPAMRQCHWLEGLEAVLCHFGGVPEECVVDNAKALVGRTVEVEVEGGELSVRWAGQVVAEHRIADGRRAGVPFLVSPRWAGSRGPAEGVLHGDHFS